MRPIPQEIVVREHGSGRMDEPAVIVLHGGPGAAGSAGLLARGLACGFRVLEPWQRGADAGPPGVAEHVSDLHLIIERLPPGCRPALVGESWGAMLALAYAAEHPDRAGPLALVGCGTFTSDARDRLRATIAERTTPGMKARLARLEAEDISPGERMKRAHEIMSPVYDYDFIGDDDEGRELPEAPPFDMRAHVSTWEDMLRLQREGVYPRAFAAIQSPVLMLHGDHDPHPGRMIAESLRPHVARLEYAELARCGHSPWRERHAREAFFDTLPLWLEEHLSRAP